MIYPYRCDACDHEFEVIKSYKDIENPEACEKCEKCATRYIALSQSFSGEADWDTAHYSQALGKVVRNNADARKQAKAAGMEEMGTEPVDKIHKHYDKMRADKAQASYDSINTNLGEIKSK